MSAHEGSIMQELWESKTERLGLTGKIYKQIYCGYCKETVNPKHDCIKELFVDAVTKEYVNENSTLSLEQKNRKEQVVHPTHYNKGIECWDYTSSHKMGFLDGNVIKYVTRFKYKNGLEDLYKAQQYLNKLIEVTEAEQKCQN